MIVPGLFLTVVIGYLLVVSLNPSSGAGERLSLSAPFGLGCTTLVIWVLLALHLPLSPTSLMTAQMSLAAGLLYLACRTKTIALSSSRPVFPKVNAGLILILLLVGAGLVFNIFFPITVSDGIGYKIHGIVAVDKKNLMAFEDVLHIGDQNRTLGFQLISGFFYLFDFDYPKLVQSVFYASMLGFFYVSIRKFMDSGPARGMTLLLATAPMVWWQSFLYLNNLSSGVYFLCGTLYWFFAIHYKQPRYMLIASFAFMLAAWTRYELIVMYMIPLAFTFFLSAKNRQARPALLLLIFPLIFSGAWAAHSFAYYPEMKRSAHYFYIFLFLLSSGIIFGVIHALQIRLRLVMGAIVAVIASAAVFVIFNELFQDKIVLLQRVLLAKLLNNTMVQCVWGLGILLVLLVPVYYRGFQPAQKYLLFNLISLFMGFTLLFSLVTMGHPMLDEPVVERIKFFLEFPGRIAVRTSSREFFILFPSLLFMLGTTIYQSNLTSKVALSFKKSLFKNSLFSGLNCLVVGNLLLISVVFLIPRAVFMKNHFGESHSELERTGGPRDIPNLYQPTYIIAHAVSRHTPEDSVVLFPFPYGALTFKKEPYNSLGLFAGADALYPRVLFWGKAELDKIRKSFPNKRIYRVTYPGWLDNQCKNHPDGKSLEYHEWYLCPIDGRNLRPEG
ncbi:MAG: hypothetical protein ACE5G9_00175 [Nitrospinales bacterium]